MPFPANELVLDDSSDVSIPEGFPKKLNWAENFDYTIRAQGKMTCCLAMSAATVYEYRLAIKKEREHELYSAQQLVNCVNPTATPVDECEGYFSTHNNGFRWIKQHGIAPESVYPYRGERRPCECINEKNTGPKVKGITNIFDAHHLIKELSQGPVAAAVEVTEEFEELTNGIYHAPTQEEGEAKSVSAKHSITIVAYGADPITKEDIFIVQNSWGGNWGIKGFGKVARDAVFRVSLPTF